jgi:predicted transcriptional regulator
MSPRAACRLQTLGFADVYDYVLGKADWLAHGLPTEGEQAGVPRAKDLLRDDVVTARLDEPVGAVRQRVAHSPYGFAFVLAEDGTLLGRLRKAALESNPDAAAQDVMEPGPSTVRPDRQLTDLLEQMRTHKLQTIVVTTPEGRLLGVLRRDDAERRLAQADAPGR